MLSMEAKEMISLIKLTENDKRILIALLLIVILLFVLIGYISLAVKKIMKFQGKRAEDMLYNVVKTKQIYNERQLRIYGIRKNWRLFFKQASKPMIILAIAWLLFLVDGILIEKNGFAGIDVWDYKTKGIGTLFFIHDWAAAPKGDFFFFKNIAVGFPPLINKPHFEITAWFSYLFIPANLIGIIWLLVCVQAYIARTFRIIKISMTIFKKTLEKPEPNIDK